MKVLVTGATGFIGGNLARELWRRGDDVRALVRPGSNRLTIEDTGIVPVEGDILDRQSIDRAAMRAPSLLNFSGRSVSAIKNADRRLTWAAISGLWIITEDGPTSGDRPLMPATSS